MKRFSSFLALCLSVATLAYPAPAYALNWDWIPKVLKFENPYRELSVKRYHGFECKVKNAWGDCIVFQKNEYRYEAAE
ncbi:MAG: hypothetical protein KC680_01975 [Candidatus Peregrinibacteria bacterium]|nr:hypothetical protein [Candidatus Peregrinibacteria bacterium]MCB9808218.1 hypothetical protein [Candidatus Peribacteria bacterium]